MSASKTEKLIKTYKELSQIPALLGAYRTVDNVIVSTWSQRNLEKGKTTKFIRSHLPYNSKYLESPAVDVSNESLSAYSLSEKLRAVIRDVDNKDGGSQFLEVWTKSNLLQSIDLTSLDLHGKVYTDGEFASFEWSKDEKKLLYVAEKKAPKEIQVNKRPPILKKTDAEKKDEVWKAEEYKQDWGEQLVGKVSSIAVVYDLESDSFSVLEGVPDNICVAQPIWGATGDHIIGLGYLADPRKLGLIYCTNRENVIFKLDLKGNYYSYPSKNVSYKSPRLSLDGQKLIWLQRKAGGPHHACMQLVQSSLDEWNPSIVVDIVDKEVIIANNKKFYGLYNTGFPKKCWTNDGRLLLSTNQKNSINAYVINLDTKVITELQYEEGSLIVLNVTNDQVLINRRNFFNQDVLLTGSLPGNGKEADIVWTNLTEKRTINEEDKFVFHYLDLEHENQDEIKTFSAIYVGPKTGAEQETTLLVYPHGGPHSSFANNLSLEISLLLSQGYAFVLINYRGSVGAGEASVNFLPGRAGTADVEDCILTTKEVLEKYPWLNKSRIGLTGGSHGGFLVTHLSGQYPDLYHAVVSRNPVIDVAAMSVVSDIPDWCYVEAGSNYTQVGALDDDLLLKMRKVSPIQHAHKVKAPTLLQVGTKDLRVPPTQSMEYYHRLKANNIEVKMNVYDDNHPIGSVPNEMSNVISSALWFDEHLHN